MNMNFYDIESLDNVFTLANFREKENNVEIFILCDDAFLVSEPDFQQKLLDRIYMRNHNFNGTVTLYDLHTEAANDHMASTFGLSDAYMVNDPLAKGNYPEKFRIVCDTDEVYQKNEDAYPLFGGYNSYNYDTTMSAMYFHEVYQLRRKENEQGKMVNTSIFMPTTANQMRHYNDCLFLPRFKNQMPTFLTQRESDNWHTTNYRDPRWIIRKNMLMTGRHIDIARLNEKQSKVALKRLLGMEGYQILESKKLTTGQDHIENPDQLYDLIAYNVSDVVNLRSLFYHELYQGQFALKKGLLKSYPELIYQQLENGEYKPDKRPEKVRRDRLFIDSSSAQFATKCLCPYGHLTDMPVVSFNYPTAKKAQELGIKQVNVLEEAKNFFYGLYPQPEIRAKFDLIYNYYKGIEGKNFNESQNYQDDYPEDQYPNNYPAHNLKEIEKAANCMPYYDHDGNPTSCFITFSVGGIHGAEYNQALFNADMEEFLAKQADMNYAKSMYPDPVDLRKAKSITMPDGRVLKYTVFLKSGRKIPDSEYKDISKQEPQLFKLNDDGSTKLHPRYVYTSAGKANHEDFVSYYPNLLRMMEAFFNPGLGYDRYAEIFYQKQDYGFLMKPKNQNLTLENAEKYKTLRENTNLPLEPLHISDEERAMYGILREGTKLILNSASGAGDATFESNIRMNNTIISMRIIGQLFSWRIGQAQAYQGAQIISTNTDGLYSVMEEDLNNQILAKESADIGIEIEPEPLYLISKDTNNRIELDLDTNIITGASGGTLACRKGPHPGKALAHPAIIDWALAEYLIVAAQGYKGLSLDAPFDEEIGRNILNSAQKKFEPIKLLNMFQNVIASSPGSINYIFGVTDNKPGDPIILSHYNRVFIMKDQTPETIHLYAANAKAITDATRRKRKRDKTREIEIDPIALHVLMQNGVAKPPAEKDIVIKKVTGIDNNWYMLVQNKDLHDLTPDEYRFIEANLDYEKYLTILKNGFENNWRNHMPGIEYEISDDIYATETDD